MSQEYPPRACGLPEPSADAEQNAHPPQVLMPLCEFNASQESIGETPPSGPPSLRIEFGDARCASGLDEGVMFTFEEDPVQFVSVFHADRLVAVGTLVGEDGRLGVRIERVVAEFPAAEAA